ncbi:MAG: hypothetical protein CM15mP39_08040 [Synechococcus sp.]|nr:MAG: hypothetical protein CM15mP39_08040 [Synechococcus sp.]
MCVRFFRVMEATTSELPCKFGLKRSHFNSGIVGTARKGLSNLPSSTNQLFIKGLSLKVLSRLGQEFDTLKILAFRLHLIFFK